MSPIIAHTGSKPLGDYTPCPAGTFAARLVDVSEVFEETKQYGNEPPKTGKFIKLCWVVSQKMEDGRLFSVPAKFGLSLHPKSRLRPIVLSMLGRGLTPDEEMHGVDIEGLIGTDCLISVVHNRDQKDAEKVYANVQNVMGLPNGMPPCPPSPEFVRWKDREMKPKWWPEHPVVEAAKKDATGHGWAPEKIDDRLPF